MGGEEVEKAARYISCIGLFLFVSLFCFFFFFYEMRKMEISKNLALLTLSFLLNYVVSFVSIGLLT